MAASPDSAITRAYPLLNAAALTDADLAFWTVGELYEAADDHVQRLARVTGVFAERDAAQTLNENQSEYPTPARHLSMVHLSAANLELRPVSFDELEALDSSWQTATGTPTRYAMDLAGLATATLYKKPQAADEAKVLAFVYHEYPAAIAQGGATLRAPQFLEDFMTLAAVMEARAKDTDGAMPEIVRPVTQHLALYEAALSGYFGGAQ